MRPELRLEVMDIFAAAQCRYVNTLPDWGSMHFAPQKRMRDRERENVLRRAMYAKRKQSSDPMDVFWRECQRQRCGAYYRAHRDRLIARERPRDDVQRAREAEYRSRKKETIRARMRAWHVTNRDRVKAVKKAWNSAHTDQVNAASRRRYRAKRAATCR